MSKPDKPMRSLAMLSKCHNCTGGYIDGKVDCEVEACELYPWMPFRKQDPHLTWMDFNPRRVGLVTWEESEREMTSEQRIAAADRLRKMRTAKVKVVENKEE
jgi:hypothetical protein